MTEVQVARGRPGDLPEILALNQQIQPHLKRSLELLRWQYFESPPQNSRIYLVREPKTKALVSCYGAVSQWLQLGGARVEAWMIQDVMTHPEHRGKGLLHALAATCFAEMRSLGVAGYTFPNELSQMSFMRTGWTRVSLIPSREAMLGTGLNHGVRALEPIDSDGLAAAESIWDESGLSLGIRRDAAFLRWRYRKPGETYALFSDRTDYFAALKLYDTTEGRMLHVLDLFTRRLAQGQIAELLAACIDFGMRHAAVRATAWLSANHPYAEAFDSLGLVLRERPQRFFYTDFPEAAEIPSSFWHLTQGDSDVY